MPFRKQNKQKIRTVSPNSNLQNLLKFPDQLSVMVPHYLSLENTYHRNFHQNEKMLSFLRGDYSNYVNICSKNENDVISVSQWLRTSWFWPQLKISWVPSPVQCVHCNWTVKLTHIWLTWIKMTRLHSSMGMPFITGKLCILIHTLFHGSYFEVI